MGKPSNPKIKNEEENDEYLRKHESKYRKTREDEAIFLSWPLEFRERVATALLFSSFRKLRLKLLGSNAEF